MSDRQGGKAFSAVRWIIAGTAMQRLVNLAGLALIARLIDKEGFGVYRELLSLHLVTFVILPLGFDQLLVREAHARPHYLSALRGALVISSLALATLLLFAQPLLAMVLKLREYGYLLWAFPALLIVQAVKLSYKVPLATELSFRRISIGEFLYTTVSTIGGVLLLIKWKHPGALYAAYGIAELAELAWLWSRHKVQQRASVSDSVRTYLELAPRHAKFSGFFCGDQILNTLSTNLPVLALGASISHNAAASFAMANMLLTIPLYMLVGAIGRVALPTMTGRTEEQLHSHILLILRACAAFIAPVMVWIAVMAPDIVPVALGDKWVDDTIVIVRWIALYCVLVSMFSPISGLDILRDRPDLGFYWNLATMVARMGALYAGLHSSLLAAVQYFAVASVVMWFLYGCLMAWLLRAGYTRFFKAWLPVMPLWLLLALLCHAASSLAAGRHVLALALALIPLLIHVAAVRVFLPGTMTILQKMLPSGALRFLGSSGARAR